MSGPDLCPKCKGLAERIEPRDSTLSAKRPADTKPPKPKRNGNRHRPGYFTEYMREYRKGLRRRNANN